MARILQLIASDHRRGAETFAHQLAGELETLGHDVRVVAISGDGTGLPVEIAGRSRRDLRGLRRIVDAARWSDVVVGAGSTTLLVGAGAAKSARRPFVYRSIGDPSIWGQVPLADLRVGLPARSAARIVTVFPEATETFRRRYRVPTSRLTTITNGVPAAPFHPAVRQDTAAARARLGLAPGRRWVGLVGALSPEKDPLLALRALSRLDDEVGLVVAGGGSLDDEVRMAASELGDRVRLLGVTDDIGSVYASIDVLVLPSRTEGVPAVAALGGVAQHRGRVVRADHHERPVRLPVRRVRAVPARHLALGLEVGEQREPDTSALGERPVRVDAVHRDAQQHRVVPLQLGQGGLVQGHLLAAHR